MFDRNWLITPLLILTSIAFRLAFQHSIETRYQIVILWLIAASYEAIRYSSDASVSLKRLATNLIVTTICITFVRWRLEGLPFDRL
jgi:hypothetical protein